MHNPLKNLIEIIKTGSREEVKEAQKQVDEFWHDVYIPQREKGKKAFLIFLEEIKKFDEIKDVDHQVYFINTLKRVFWSIGEEYFEIWAEFILRYIQHPSGKIRQAIIHASDYLVMDITEYLRFDDDKEETINQMQKEIVKKNKERFCRLVSKVEELLEKYDEPRFHRYKYISSMPASVYKSLQKLIVEVLLRSEYYEELYQKWLSSKARTSESVLVEESLLNLLEKYNLSEKLTLGMVRDWIWNDEGESVMDASNRFHKKWFKYFSNVEDIDEFNKILQVFVDCWNYFPHKSLGGKSPDLMVKETLQKHPEYKKEDNHKMPDVVVGGQKMDWDDYWSMIAEMEKQQEPFKKFIKEELLPRYKKFLEEDFQPKIAKQHMEVADIFFQRVMHLGFIEFKDIRRDFIQKEFPKWWPTHVWASDLSEKEVLSSLRKLFEFIALFYEVDIKRFGFE